MDPSQSVIYIKKIRSELGLTQAKLAEKLGVDRRTIINYEQGSVIPDSKLKMLELIIKDSKRNVKSETKSETNTLKEPEAIWVEFNRFKLVPLVSHRAQAGFLSGWGDDEYEENLPRIPFEIDREYKGKYVCFEVSGDSMQDGSVDSIMENDLLLCREVQRHHWRNHLHINQWDFVIVHRMEGILVKRIIKHNTENGRLVLHSLNPLYEDFEVYMDDLIAIFNVVKVDRNRRR